MNNVWNAYNKIKEKATDIAKEFVNVPNPEQGETSLDE